MGMAASPPVEVLPGRLPPMLWAVGRPRMLLPEAFRQVEPASLDALLAHELAHLRRRDHWVRVLEFVALGLYWWLPVAWYARTRLREAEEQCCDAWVVAVLPGSGRTYAAAIVDVLDFLACAPAACPVLASGLGHVTHLKRRLRMIMSGTTPRALGWRGFAAVLVLGVMALPLLPAWVQGQAQGDEERPQPPRRQEDGDRRGPPRGERREPPPPVKVDEKAREELKRLQDEVNKRANELAQVAKRLQEAAHEATKGQGPAEGRRPGPLHVEGLPPIAPPLPEGREPQGFMLRKMGDNWVVFPMPPDFGRFGGRGERGGPDGRGPDGRGPEQRGGHRPPPPDGQRPDDRGGPGERGGRRPPPPPDGRGPDDRGGPGAGREHRPPPGPPPGREGRQGHEGREGRPDGGDRVDRLERRLDAVMHALEEIRRELGPQRGNRPPGPPPGERK
jgi:hypothetical protein